MLLFDAAKSKQYLKGLTYPFLTGTLIHVNGVINICLFLAKSTMFKSFVMPIGCALAKYIVSANICKL